MSSKRSVSRCQYTGKVTNGRPVILAEKGIMIEYLKKEGYKIIPPRQKAPIPKAQAIPIMALICMMLLPMVSALPVMLTMDLTQQHNILLLILYFGISLFLYVTKRYLYSGFMVLIGGIIMILNSVNFALSLVIIVVGITIAMQKGGNQR